ncbi:aldo/keto reductase [Amycolatopsis australiensis]|uniref:Predicted oxidoreductase n=1 Tax=Amycolatopsis australiensis TaxID=546364 RepID=A0A1K1QA79_9PSEU|nr:aldo/keto reductase [Amycolatopsis australiensis]SFW56094.1 Predicted oxidoreductase [Amycolatopsis australiensis]
MTKLGNTDLDVYGLNLGGNVFGWTADEAQSFAVLDAYTTAGGNFVDTADLYGGGGRSEEILGNWLATRGNRDDVVIATKVGMWDARPGLSAKNIQAAAEDSLRRLGTDHIDLYYAHRDDPGTPLEETLEAFDALVRAGKVRHIGASNYSAERLAAALSISDRNGFARYAVLQPHYNLVERGYERDLAPLVEREGLATLPYFALAKGFLTGKYRTKDETGDSPRAARAASYLDHGGERVLAALDEVAAARGVSVATVALAWLRQQPTVAAPIASARTPRQLTDLVASVTLELTADELAALSRESEPTVG